MAATMDYSKMKNAELETLLKERSLPHTGKKAEMVARLADHDKSTGAAPPTAIAASSTLGSTDASRGSNGTTSPLSLGGDATSESAAAAMAAGGTVRAENPVAVPNQQVGEDPTKSNDLSVSKDASTSAAAPVSSEPAAATAAETKAAEAAKFSSHMPATDLEVELEKRKARAKKFGLEETESEAIKALERAKRFGTGATGEQSTAEGTKLVKGLDEALPERGGRKRARGGLGGENADDGGMKRRKGPAFREKPERQRSDADRGRGGASWLNEQDRAAAEARKAKFAQGA